MKLLDQGIAHNKVKALLNRSFLISSFCSFVSSY